MLPCRRAFLSTSTLACLSTLASSFTLLPRSTSPRNLRIAARTRATTARTMSSSQEASITLMVENTARGRNILGEHGLSWWIEFNDKRVLFDTGQGQALLHNAKTLNLPVDSCDAIVLSHGHYDHVGGLEQVLEHSDKENKATIFMHQTALDAKYSGSTGTSRCISIPFLHGGDLKKKYQDRIRTFSNQDGPVEIVPGLYCTGEIPRRHDWEDTGGPFYLDAELSQPDLLLDDVSLFFESDKGIVIILGCCHSGILNTVDYIQELVTATTNKNNKDSNNLKPIHSVMGGLHLLSATNERMNKTIQGLKERNIQAIYPCHCTGDDATFQLQKSLPEGVVRHAHAGSHWSFHLAEDAATATK